MKSKTETNGKTRDNFDVRKLDYQVLGLVTNEFKINAPRINADEHSQFALSALKDKYAASCMNLRQELVKGGHSATIDEVSKKINKSGIHNNLRYLLSEECLYVTGLYEVIAKEGITDTQGVYSRILANASVLKIDFYTLVTSHVIEEANLNKSAIPLKALLLEVVKTNPFS